MSKWLTWASDHKAAHLVLLLTFYLLVVLPHEVIGLFIASLFFEHGRPFFDQTMLIFSVALFSLCAFALSKRIIQHPHRGRLMLYLLVNMILAILCFTVLFVVNVEAIHFVQYAIFAILVFPIVRNYFQAHTWATLAGTFDELYQYTILSPELQTKYFDFNDVVIDMVGAGFGLIAIRAYNPRVILHSWNDFKKTKLFKLLLILLVGLVLLFAFGFASYHPADSSYFVLVKEEIPWFWNLVTHHIHPDIIFHVLTPLEGIVLIIMILWFFIGIEKGSENFTLN